jgi:glycosyltransferase involved in cell wall biosynthesis
MVIARALAQALRDAGHQSDIIVTPDHGFGRQTSAYLATWFTNVATRGGHRIDQVISLRYPSYAVRHPRHVSWLNHTMREYYDLWDRFRAGLSWRGRIKEAFRRRAIHTADRYLLTRNVSRVFVQSRTIQRRLRIWPELESTVLHPPAPPRAYRCDGYEDFVFMISRLTPLKRAELLIRALGTWDGSGIRAVIAGDGEERERLDALVLELGLSNRVTLPGALTEPQLLDHLARCRVVCFPPLDEDYGFVTTEAFASSKAVVTCRDSGGPAELVEHGVTGLVCDSTPEALARALRTLMDDRGRAETMGAAARRSGSQLSWPDAVRQLTAL